jgi:hypothetical protein
MKLRLSGVSVVTGRPILSIFGDSCPKILWMWKFMKSGLESSVIQNPSSPRFTTFRCGVKYN